LIKRLCARCEQGALTWHIMYGVPIFTDAIVPDLLSPGSPALKALQALAKRLEVEVSFVIEEVEESSFLRVVPKWALPEYRGVRPLDLPSRARTSIALTPHSGFEGESAKFLRFLKRVGSVMILGTLFCPPIFPLLFIQSEKPPSGIISRVGAFRPNPFER